MTISKISGQKMHGKMLRTHPIVEEMGEVRVKIDIKIIVVVKKALGLFEGMVPVNTLVEINDIWYSKVSDEIYRITLLNNSWH